MFSKLMPKEESFFDFFEALAAKIVEGCRVFEEMLKTYSRPESRKESLHNIVELEHRCDEIAHSVYERVNKVFITPIDREDIQLLVQTMDDVIDSIRDLAEQMVIYEIEKVPPGLPEMARVLIRAMEEVKPALQALRNFKDPERILAHCVEINRLENEHDALVREEIGRLFREDKDNPLRVIKLKDVYETIEVSLDRCEDIADVIESITVKYA